ncbi:thyrotropin-releasing hormone receptor-like isoform X1 [Homarus americanus]|uniref:thyrotropin-releasing hormone receptor-like isoform X1 n=1 Tax=Homarus americanus TaxID=6706 RepID=UPI001C44E96E|nr:thyrotropin-releasing hormone receptor-like isoform X1 [Homarus americanus]XP_042233163.1 thyrotropin-releasing hormone receptor-like isoform X1 [Homarus americanus]
MLNISTAAPLLAAALTTLAPPTLQPPITTDPYGNFSYYYNSTDLEATEASEQEIVDISGYEAFLDISRYVVQRVLVPMVLVVGVVGNAVTIVVLTRRQMRSSTNNYLTALAISDLLYLVFIFSLSIRHHPGMSRPHHWFYWHYFRYALWLTDASSSTSIWLTVTFTIERYIAVCHPIKGKVFCTESRAKRVIVAVFILCFALTATTPHEWVINEVTDATGQARLVMNYSVLGSNATYKKVFYWFTAVIFILLPLVLLAVFNSFLIHVVKLSRAQRRTMTNHRVERDNHSQSQENKITIMLIAVVLLALVCQLPVAVLLLYTTVYVSEPHSNSQYVELSLGNIFNLLAAINAACNFVLYCAMSDKYRRTFLRTFCSRWYRQPSPLHSWMATAYSNVEDGSPRFSRMSSMRMSRRSSYRSSGSGSPRGSPTHGRGLSGGRPGHYLTVPSPSHNPTPALLTPTKTALLHPVPDDVSRPLLKKTSSGKNGSDNGNAGVTSPAVTASAATLLNGSPNSQTPAPSAPPPGAASRFARRLSSLLPQRNNTSTQLAGRHIVITCQQPSVDEQTAL